MTTILIIIELLQTESKSKIIKTKKNEMRHQSESNATPFAKPALSITDNKNGTETDFLLSKKSTQSHNR